MNFIKDVPFKLPVLITRGLVLFPGETETLIVERNFTINAVKFATKSCENYILITSQINPLDNDIKDFNSVYQVGTVCKIIEMSSVKNGVKIKVNAVQRVILSDGIRTNDCWYCEGVIYPDIYGDSTEEEVAINDLFANLEKLIELSALKQNMYTVLASKKGVYALDVSYVLSANFDFSTDEKQQLLQAKTVNERLIKLISLTENLIAKAEVEKNIQDKVRDSTEKNQKEYILREKLRAIQDELGDGSNSNSKILEKLESGDYPDNIVEKIKDELKKMEMMPQGSLESGLIKSYIDLLLNLPWKAKTVDNDDLNAVKKVLDNDHYGLEKPKKRILEYLAVKQMTGNLKAPIICFYGPPGTGKTSLGKSIAKSLGRNFVKISLGGVSDEAEIRGFKRTYVGAAPGQIIQGLKKSKTNNPVFLLDEIDKLDKSYHGNPASALLEVLDPEQNVLFTDNFIEEPFDLSNVLFICTANYLENIPAPLLDRLELIELNSYTENEKLNIAKKHLISKALESNGLTSKNLKFTDAGIIFIIERYTRESGVRELERLINTICRKVCVKILNGEKSCVSITSKNAKEFLGVEIFDNSEKEKESQVGVVTGLAYTQFGGDILPIEVNKFSGKGELILTGKLGDVMKESCAIALGYVKSKAEKYGINPDIFKETDIHIHVPEGAVPKDGPSAGVAITIAIISCLTNRPVDNNIGMTGEVTLRGNSLPIGGLREKSLAALRSGLKEIIVPLKNKNVVDELPQEVKDKLKINFMSCVDDAVKIVLKG